ncbi:MAG: VCBS repeat-containing protein [Candidatus Sumerlaeaceae bacterium]|nr:VCBS repeat-containing protein [Candidatus Sumerlaeaceae bacterium]
MLRKTLIRSQNRLLSQALALALLMFMTQRAQGDRRSLSLISVDVPRQEITAGSTVHPVDLFGDARKELVVVQDGVARILALEGRNYAVKQRLDFSPPQTASGKTYYCFARLGAGASSNIILVKPEGVFYYPLSNEGIAPAPALLLDRPLIQGQSSGGRFQYAEFAQDLNGDGLDDLLLPEQNGFAILRQSAPLQFQPVKLPRTPYTSSNRFDFQRLLTADAPRVPVISAFMGTRRGVDNLLLFDANGDGRQDLVYTKTVPAAGSREADRYEVFLQGNNFSFSSQPQQVMDVPYETNADVTFRDLNRDGLLDAIVVQSNLDIVNPRTVVKFYTAQRARGELTTRESERFVTKDPIGIVRVDDFNRDGYADFALTYFSYQFGSAEDIVDLALANRITFRLQFYLAAGSSGFSRRPDAEQELQISMKPDSYSGYPPVHFVRDMNGDGFTDLVLRADEGKAEVYVSDGAVRFRRQPSAEINLPQDSILSFDDLNADGLTDIVISSRQRETVLIYLSSPRR